MVDMSKYEGQRAPKTVPHVALGDVRAASGKTLEQVCELANEVLPTKLTRGALSAIENGHRGASVQVLRALEVAYGIRAGAIVTDYEPRVWREGAPLKNVSGL